MNRVGAGEGEWVLVKASGCWLIEWVLVQRVGAGELSGAGGSSGRWWIEWVLVERVGAGGASGCW